MKKLVLLISFSLIFASCQKMSKSNSGLELFPKTEGKSTIAEFDGIKITDTYIKSYLDQLNPYLKSRYNTPEKKEELVRKIIEGEVLARYAMKKGSVQDPVLLTKLKSTIARHYSSSVLKGEIEEALKVSEEDMKKYFEENKDKYIQPAKMKASHILIKVEENAPEEEWKKAKAKANKVYNEVMKKKDDPKAFAQLVKKHSDDPGSKRRGGDVGYFAKTEEGGRMVKEFSDTAFNLEKVGNISEIVKSKFGYHIIKLTGKRERVEKSFADVKNRIESSLKSERRKDAYQNTLDKIKKDMNFSLNKEAVAKLDLGVSEKIKDASQDFDKRRKGMPKRPAMDPKKLQEAIKNKMKLRGKKPNMKPAEKGGK